MIFEDTFQRADNADLGVDWIDTDYGGPPGVTEQPQIVSHTVRPKTVVEGSVGMYVTQPGNDQFATARLAVPLVANGYFGVHARWAAPPGASGWHGYYFNVGIGGYEFAKWVNGSWTFLADGALPVLQAGETISIVAVGSLISCWVNKQQIVAVTDTSHVAGLIGFGIDVGDAGALSDAQINGFRGGDYTTADFFGPAMPIQTAIGGVLR